MTVPKTKRRSHTGLQPFSVNIQRLIAEYIAGIGTRPKAPTRVNPKQADKSRHFHVMHDDAAFKVKLHRAPAAPDPMALPAGFFAPRQADPEPRLAMPVIPPKPQGFPVPGEYRFQVPA